MLLYSEILCVEYCVIDNGKTMKKKEKLSVTENCFKK